MANKEHDAPIPSRPTARGRKATSPVPAQTTSAAKPRRGGKLTRKDKGSADVRYKDPDGLTLRQRKFVNAYVANPSNAAAAARAGGYSVTTSNSVAFNLLDKPAIQNAIRKAFERVGVVDLECVTRELIALHLSAIRTRAQDIWFWDGVDLKIKPFSEMPAHALDAIAGMSRKPGEFGYEDKIELEDRLQHMKALAQLVNAQRGVRSKARAEVADILTAVLEKRMTPGDAALQCDIRGIAIPESVKLLLAKEKPQDNGQDEDEVPELTPEQLEAQAQARLAEVAKQKGTFLPERQAAVLGLKAEQKARDYFAVNDF